MASEEFAEKRNSLGVDVNSAWSNSGSGVLHDLWLVELDHAAVDHLLTLMVSGDSTSDGLSAVDGATWQVEVDVLEVHELSTEVDGDMLALSVGTGVHHGWSSVETALVVWVGDHLSWVVSLNVSGDLWWMLNVLLGSLVGDL